MENNIQLSIIIPLYKGKRFVEGLVESLEEELSNANFKTEIIFINDYPEENVEEIESKSLEVVVVQNSKNLGIHASRLKGLRKAKGQFVHFLDQDDTFQTGYYMEQMSQIGEADAIVSNVYHFGKMMYEEEKNPQQIVELDYLLKKGNHIVTPGQVIIKKNSIPQKWQDTIIQNNGADDYFLWICMAYEKRSIKFNLKCYMYHNINEMGNASEDVNKMRASVSEVLFHCCFSYFDNVIQYDYWNYLQNKFERSRKLQEILERWMVLRDKNSSIMEYLQRNNLSKISIYGMGKFGNHLYYELKDKIEIEYLFDQNVRLVDGIKVVDFGKNPKSGLDIIIAIIGDNSSLRTKLESCGNRIIELQDIL